jgi:PKD repeat protein
MTNPLTWPIVGRDSKVSFCLVNNFNCSANLGYCVDSLGNPISHTNTGNPGLGVASGCGREQGIFPGYLDIYYPGYDGQEIKFDSSLCNGEYYIVSTTDPANAMLEMNENNNTSVVPIKITAQQNGNCCTAGFKADTLTGIAPFEVNFIDTTKPSSAKWFWEFGDGKTDTTQFPTHVYTHAGNFTVSLTTVAKETGCTNTATKNKYIKVRNNTTTVTSNQFQVYPNPFTKVVNIFYATTLASTNTISILDIAGRTVYTKDLGKEEPGLHEVTLTPVIPSGVYLIKLTIGNVTQYSKVIKQ